MNTPCAEGDAEDWFIGRDGKQYPDEEFLDEGERERIAKTVLAKSGETEEEHASRVESTVAQVVRDRRTKALQRRRRARSACYECPLRGQCLDLAINTQVTHGTWGGYYEEELRTIRNNIAERAR